MRNQVQLFETTLLDAVDLSENQVSEAEAIVHYPKARAINNFSIQVIWDGDDVGFTFDVEASLDGVNFTVIDCATSIVATDSGNLILNFFEQTFKVIRVKTTADTGTGTVTAKFLAWSRFI